MNRQRPLRVGDPIPPDAVEFIRAVRQLPPDNYKALLECITSFPLGLSGYEKCPRMGIALGHSEGTAAAHAAPLRRKHLCPVR
jgi:hypothetical protein